MSEIPSDLDGLRRRIDEIDDRLQDLLAERLEIVAGVAAHKRGKGAIAAHQPAREAEIIRRLVRRNKGGFPAATLVRMWRELLGATVQLQSSFAVAVYAPPQTPGYWDLARDHYGSQTPMVPYRSTSHVIGAVMDLGEFCARQAGVVVVLGVVDEVLPGKEAALVPLDVRTLGTIGTTPVPSHNRTWSPVK